MICMHLFKHNVKQNTLESVHNIAQGGILFLSNNIVILFFKIMEPLQYKSTVKKN